MSNPSDLPADFAGYYASLGVGFDASRTEIVKAFRRKAMALHPDRNQHKDSTDQFQQLQLAYSVLTDLKKRAAYHRKWQQMPTGPIVHAKAYPYTAKPQAKQAGKTSAKVYTDFQANWSKAKKFYRTYQPSEHMDVDVDVDPAFKEDEVNLSSVPNPAKVAKEAVKENHQNKNQKQHSSTPGRTHSNKPSHYQQTVQPKPARSRHERQKTRQHDRATEPLVAKISPIKMTFAKAIEKIAEFRPANFWGLGSGLITMVLVFASLMFLLLDQEKTVEIAQQVNEIVALHKQPVNPAPRPVYPQFRLGDNYVLPKALKLRVEAGIDSAVVSMLERFETLHGIGLTHLDEGWLQVTTESGLQGYVAERYLGFGNGLEANSRACTSYPQGRPKTGTITRSQGQGQHQLSVHNPLQRDALLQIRAIDGSEYLELYVRGGATIVYQGLRYGAYHLNAASGDVFNVGCGYFMLNEKNSRFLPTLVIDAKGGEPTNQSIAIELDTGNLLASLSD